MQHGRRNTCQVPSPWATPFEESATKGDGRGAKIRRTSLLRISRILRFVLIDLRVSHDICDFSHIWYFHHFEYRLTFCQIA